MQGIQAGGGRRALRFTHLVFELGSFIKRKNAETGIKHRDIPECNFRNQDVSGYDSLASSWWYCGQ